MAYSVTEGRGSEILALSAIMIVFSTIAIGLRFWGRHIAHRCGLWWDDWLSLPALVRDGHERSWPAHILIVGRVLSSSHLSGHSAP